MRNRIIVCFFAILLLGVTNIGFAQQGQQLQEIQEGVVDLAEGISKSLPFNSALGLNWSDAYIGQVFPGSPAHFGAGISVGLTTMEMAPIENLLGYLGSDISLGWSKMPIPAYTVEGRIGGFSFPFDIGLKFGYLPSLAISDITLNYLLVGGDIRYAVMDGMTNTARPNLSVGLGLNYLSGGVGASIGGTQEISFDDYFTGYKYTILLDQPEMNLDWHTFSLDLKAQISKTFSILTPYLGLGGSYAWTSTGYSVNADVRMRRGSGAFNPIGQAEIDTLNRYLQDAGLEPMDIDAKGISSIIENSAFNVRAYGGFSVNLSAFRLDLTGLFNFLDQNLGVSLGFRFQK